MSRSRSTATVSNLPSDEQLKEAIVEFYTNREDKEKPVNLKNLVSHLENHFKVPKKSIKKSTVKTILTEVIEQQEESSSSSSEEEIVIPKKSKDKKKKKSKKKSSKGKEEEDGREASAKEDDMLDDEEVGDKVNRAGMKADYEGFLQKKGNAGLIKVFRKRFFRFYKSEALICYFKSEKVFEQIGSINLKGVLLVEKSDQKTFAFNITMKTSARVWQLSAPDDSARQKWMEIATQFITMPYEAPPAPVEGKKKLKTVYPVEECLNFTEIEQSLSTRAARKAGPFKNPGQFEVPAREVIANDTAITLLGDEEAYIQEVRELSLDENGAVWVNNLPKTLKEKQDSLHFRSLTDPKASVIEQTFYFDRKDASELLGKVIGKPVGVSIPKDRHFAPETSTFEGKVVFDKNTQSFALHDTDKVHFLDTKDIVSFDLKGVDPSTLTDGPETLFHEPSVNWVIESEEKKHLAEVTYAVAESFEWWVTYNCVVNVLENTLDLTSWYNIKNKAGKTFENVTLIFHPKEKAKKEEDKEKEESVEEKATSALKGGLGALGSLVPFGKKPVVEPPRPKRRKYFLGPRKVTLPEACEKQFRLASTSFPIKSLDFISFETPKYQFKAQTGKDYGTDAKAKVETVFQFVNNEATGLGFELPAGTVNVYRREKDGFALEKLVQTSIGHTDPNERITLSLESLEHVSATRVQTGFNFDTEKLFMVETFEITIVNSRLEPVELVVEESLYRWQSWEITSSEPAFKKSESHPRKIYWNISLESLKDVTIKYTVFYARFSVDD